jgi:peptide/nickel transport system permease protein
MSAAQPARPPLTPSLVIGAAISLAIVLLALLAPVIATHDVEQMDMANRFAWPSWQHWLGSDNFGRDVWSRLIFGARISLTIALASVGLSAAIGTAVGLASGYLGGWVDHLLMRVTDVFLGFPALVLALAVIAMLGPGEMNVVAALACVFWTEYARVVRASALVLREREYVAAARLIGVSGTKIALVEILPNAAGPVIVLATLGLGTAVIAESALSFLGFGVPPPQPTWGWALAFGTKFMRNDPWLSIVSGFAIMVTVLGFNLLGDGLRDYLDPRQARRRGL